MAIDPSVDPTLADLERARLALEAAEPRSFFYRVALEAVDLALAGRTSLTVAEGLAILLQTWNASHYRFRPFDNRLLGELERVVVSQRAAIAGFRPRRLETLAEEDAPALQRVYNAFECLLGPDGAARCLHLFAPRFFPMWDHTIARVYGLPLSMTCPNGGPYHDFVRLTRQQCLRLGGEQALGRNPLRAIDEYNYCRCKRWL